MEGRVESGFAVIEGWNGNVDLMKDCRDELLKVDLMQYSENEEYPLLSGLCRWFQKNMTWVNEPPCQVCGVKDHMKFQQARPATTPKERQGKASRVEVYQCDRCHTTTDFARYNCVRTLWKERKGRCGEYANLFGFVCSSMGMTVRYILDSTDHVWVEVLSSKNNRWIMADGCEGQIDQPGMYEQGWGKKGLTCILAFDAVRHSVTDVTPRYTRNYSTLQFQEHHHALRQLLPKYNSSTKVEPCDQLEQEYFSYLKTHNPPLTWQKHEYTNQGRQSGSYAWKALRHELGNQSSANDTATNITQIKKITSIKEHFLPHLSPTTIDIHVTPSHMTISKVVLPTKIPKEEGDDHQNNNSSCIFMAIVDETSGCILQTRQFHDWTLVNNFINSIPNGRILALSSYSTITAFDNTDTTSIRKQISLRVGGFPSTISDKSNSSTFLEKVDKDHVCLLFIGQVNHCPDWYQYKVTTTPTTESISVCLKVNGDASNDKVSISLQKAPNTVPNQIVGRLPDSIMPLSKQIDEQDNDEDLLLQSFQTYQKDNPNIIGFTTRPACPIYLLSQSAYPLTTTDDMNGTSTIDPYENIPWTTYYSLPSPIVTKPKPSKSQSSEALFDIPVEETLLDQVIGPTLLSSTNMVMETSQVLKDVRLIGLYFSAHWCGPCRSFTPKLAQFYKICRQELKLPMEIIFVSSDRSEQDFQQYFQSSMPWYAIPYPLSKQPSRFFSVQGIPSLIILDSISGQIVVPAQQSRNDILQTFSTEMSIRHLVENTWMNQIPEESQMIYQTLALSCQQEDDEDDNNNNDKPNTYLVQDTLQQPPLAVNVNKKQDPSKRIQELFTKFTQTEGMEPNAAAAKAIQILSQEQQEQTSTSPPKLTSGNLKSITNNKEKNDDLSSKNMDVDIAKIILKYIQNARKYPHTPKYRSIKVSNKVFDRIMTKPGGLDQLLSSGYIRLCHNQTDFFATIPLDADLDAIYDQLNSVINDEKQS